MPWLTSIAATLTVAGMFMSMLGGIYGHGARKTFLGGFAIGAWGFHLLIYGIYDVERLGDRVMTGMVLDRVGNALFGEPPVYGLYGSQDPLEIARSDLDIIGHCLFSLACGLLSGFIAIRFARTERARERLVETQSYPLSESTSRREHHPAFTGADR